MAKLGVVTMNWADTRYFSAVCLLLKAAHRLGHQALVIHTPRPWFWISNDPLPATNVPEHCDVYGVPFITFDGGYEHTEDATRNFAIDVMRGMGVEVVVWLDADFLFGMADWERLLMEITNAPPQPWSADLIGFWRTFNTTYERKRFLLATDVGCYFPKARVPVASHIPVTCYHPSYVLTDAEVQRKISSWGHADTFADLRWMEEWLDGSIDRSLDLKPFDGELPPDLKAWLKARGELG